MIYGTRPSQPPQPWPIRRPVQVKMIALALRNSVMPLTGAEHNLDRTGQVQWQRISGQDVTLCTAGRLHQMTLMRIWPQRAA